VLVACSTAVPVACTHAFGMMQSVAGARAGGWHPAVPASGLHDCRQERQFADSASLAINFVNSSSRPQREYPVSGRNLQARVPSFTPSRGQTLSGKFHKVRLSPVTLHGPHVADVMPSAHVTANFPSPAARTFASSIRRLFFAYFPMSNHQ
jgi:hypothetical protein